MKNITTFLCLTLLIGCSTTQSNINVDAVETFNLNNYSDFNIKINNENISAEVNPIVLERFKENLKIAIEERGLKFNANSNITFDINFTTKEMVKSNRYNTYYSRYYSSYYMWDDDIYNVTQNILRVNLRDINEDKTLWTVVTVWRDKSTRSISYDDASNMLVDEIMMSFL
ncbi:MAG: DUF4136 domain-containing protein [Gammaproteobacteria bacterium]|jgi:hypothetical protein|nr:MAG: hypothetical protein CBD85_001460 [Gammaproteobacteria bacterium TMED225]|tara:strand:- start:1072 stop:1584 length:513 start_codon:yes stop_codon:yes gene_type:complete